MSQNNQEDNVLEDTLERSALAVLVEILLNKSVLSNGDKKRILGLIEEESERSRKKLEEIDALNKGQ